MNRRTFLTALAGLPLVGRLAPTVPQGIIPTTYLGEVFIPPRGPATGLDVYFAPAGTPFPALTEQPSERWTLLGVGDRLSDEGSYADHIQVAGNDERRARTCGAA